MPDQDKDGHKEKDREKEREKDREKEKLPIAIEPMDHHATAVPAPPAKSASELEEAGSHYFFGEPLVGFDRHRRRIAESAAAEHLLQQFGHHGAACAV